MWQLGSDKKRRRSAGSPAYFTVVEPGTATLRLLVVEVRGERATVLGWAEGPGWTGVETDSQELVAACEHALTEAEEMAQTRSGRWVLPDQVLVGLPASQLRGRARSITQRRSNPDRPVEVQELETLLERTLRLVVNRLLSDDRDGANWVLVDAAPVTLTVDGRGVTDPVGFRGR